jgi:hypothetical protein
MRSEKVDRASLSSTSFISLGVSTLVYIGVAAGLHKRLFFGHKYNFGSHLHIISKNSRNDIK